MAFHVDPVQPWTPVHTVPEWHRNLKSWYVIDLSLAASLDPFPPGGEGVAGPLYWNRTEITALRCEQKPYAIWFSCLRKSSPVMYEDSRPY